MDLPKAIAVSDKGVPEARTFENTGEIQKAVAEAVASEENTGVALAKLILGAVNENSGHHGGGDGGDGAKYVKEIKRHKWVAAVMALLLGPGGAIAVVYATSDRSKANENHLKQLEPRLIKTEESLKEVQVDISSIRLDVSTTQSQTVKVLQGIDELKKENINKTIQELEDTKIKLRRAERDLDRR